MKRLRLYDCRISRLASIIGQCQDNIAKIAQYVNSSQERLLYCKEQGDEGWWGTFAEIAFNVSRATPYLTLPRYVARLENVVVCDSPVAVQNQFYEYLAFGNGRMNQSRCECPGILEVYARNNAVTFSDLINGPKIVRIYMTDATDVGARVLIQGLDQNDAPIYTRDGLNEVTGIYVTLATPFVDCPAQFNNLTGIQKSITHGQVKLYQVDPVTGDQSLMLTMEPGEETANYRRYYFSDLPRYCCPSTVGNNTIQVKAIAKLEPVSVHADSDYLLIQSMEAIISEVQAIRMSEMDTVAAHQMADKFHRDAVRYLIGELSHYQGINQVAANFQPFGSAHLSQVNIGMM